MILEPRLGKKKKISSVSDGETSELLVQAEEEAKREKPELFRVETEASLPSVG
jgi:hypothetical protein